MRRPRQVVSSGVPAKKSATELTVCSNPRATSLTLYDPSSLCFDTLCCGISLVFRRDLHSSLSLVGSKTAHLAGIASSLTKKALPRHVHVHPWCRLQPEGLSPDPQAHRATCVQQEDESGLWSLHNGLNREARCPGWSSGQFLQFEVEQGRRPQGSPVGLW